MVRGNSGMCLLSLSLPTLAVLHSLTSRQKLKPHVKCLKEQRSFRQFKLLEFWRKIFCCCVLLYNLNLLNHFFGNLNVSSATMRLLLRLLHVLYTIEGCISELAHPQNWAASLVAQIHPQHIKAIKTLRFSQGFHPAI